MHTRAALRRRPNSYPGTLLRDLRMFHEGERVRRGVKYAVVVNVSHPQRKFFLELEPRPRTRAQRASCRSPGCRRLSL